MAGDLRLQLEFLMGEIVGCHVQEAPDDLVVVLLIASTSG